MPDNLDHDTRDFIASLGAAPLQGIATALEAVAQAAAYGQYLARLDRDEAPAMPLGIRPSLGPTRRLDEFSAKQRLAAAGIAIPEGSLVSLEQASSVADALGFPVFIKIAHPDLSHKSEAGLLAGPLHNADEADRAVTRLIRSLESYRCLSGVPRSCGKALCLVERAIPDAVAEILVSIRHDEKFGAAMTVAGGGLFTEILNDAQTVLLPADREEILQTVASLRFWRLLQGYRGRPAGDIAALREALERLATLVLQGPEPIVAVEINPMLVMPKGVAAADALMIVQTD